jgi:hypothetical protein
MIQQAYAQAENLGLEPLDQQPHCIFLAFQAAANQCGFFDGHTILCIDVTPIISTEFHLVHSFPICANCPASPF